MSDELPVDIARIQDISDGDRAFEREVIEAYLGDVEERIQRLDLAIPTGDADTARRDAHTIKGASSNVGTTLLQEIARELEHLDLAAQPEKAVELLARVKAEFAAVREYFEAYLRA